VPGDKARVHGLIMVGLERLRGFCHKDGRFSLWCEGTPDLDTTARVAHRLLAFRDLPFEAAGDMLSRSATALRKAKVKDNQLLPLGQSFRTSMKTATDAAALYSYDSDGKVKAQAVSFLHKTAQGNNGTRTGRGARPGEAAWRRPVTLPGCSMRPAIPCFSRASPMWRASLLMVGCTQLQTPVPWSSYS
jgi:hypothetical protein